MKKYLTLSLFCLAGMAFGAQKTPKVPQAEWEKAERFIEEGKKLLETCGKGSKSAPAESVAVAAQLTDSITITLRRVNGKIMRLAPFTMPCNADDVERILNAIPLITGEIAMQQISRDQIYVGFKVKRTKGGNVCDKMLIVSKPFFTATLDVMKNLIKSKGLEGLAGEVRRQIDDYCNKNNYALIPAKNGQGCEFKKNKK